MGWRWSKVIKLSEYEKFKNSLNCSKGMNDCWIGPVWMQNPQVIKSAKYMTANQCILEEFKVFYFMLKD